jgi:hypothetical protein
MRVARRRPRSGGGRGGGPAKVLGREINFVCLSRDPGHCPKAAADRDLRAPCAVPGHGASTVCAAEKIAARRSHVDRPAPTALPSRCRDRALARLASASLPPGYAMLLMRLWRMLLLRSVSPPGRSPRDRSRSLTRPRRAAGHGLVNGAGLQPCSLREPLPGGRAGGAGMRRESLTYRDVPPHPRCRTSHDAEQNRASQWQPAKRSRVVRRRPARGDRGRYYTPMYQGAASHQPPAPAPCQSKD